MPSSFDSTYHNIYRKPVFDDEGSRAIWEASREADEVLIPRAAPLPSRDQELEYMEWLKQDLKSDPWLTHRFRKYTANPKRVPWKNSKQLKRQYQFTFATHWFVGACLSWPLAAAIGRSYKATSNGVPVTAYSRANPWFLKLEPGRTARIYFRWYSALAAIGLGYAFARLTTDAEQKDYNQLYNRPDLKPFAAMVDQTPDLGTKTMLEQSYVPQRKSDDSPLKRFFFYRTADFSIKENPYQKLHPQDIWDPKTRVYSTYTSDFGAHQP